MRSAPEYTPKSVTSRECRYCGENFTPALRGKRTWAKGKLYIVYVRSGRLTCSEACRAILTGETFSARYGASTTGF